MPKGVARHEERPTDDASPSDVDLLAIFDTTDRLVKPYREDIFATIIDACIHHLDAPMRSMCCSPTGRCRTGTLCSLRIWLVMAYSSLRVGPYQLHSLHDSLFKGFVKAKEPDIENHTKTWQDCSGMLTRWSTLLYGSGTYPSKSSRNGLRNAPLIKPYAISTGH